MAYYYYFAWIFIEAIYNNNDIHPKDTRMGKLKINLHES